MKIKEAISGWKKVFSKKSYIFLALALTFLFYLIDIALVNIKNLALIFQNRGLFQMLASLPSFMKSYMIFFPTSFFISLVILSLMFGMLFSLISYKTKMIKSVSGKVGILVTLGIFLGILAPGCPACSVGILSVMGIGATALSFLPFGGLSILIISIGIMSFSVYKISKDINKGILCEVKLPAGVKR